MKKLSVCVIYGNESNHIERFINAFESIADEFVFIRAIGSREPDGTLEIIQELSKKDCYKSKFVLGEYFNKIKEWQHVDRFCDARNMSYNMATGDLLMWADCDDVIGKETRADINWIKNNGELEVYYGYYNLPIQKHSFIRERIMDRNVQHEWKQPVHEVMVLPSTVKAEIRAGLVIDHLPLEKKQDSYERNLKMLEYWIENPLPEDWMPGLYHYAHRDHYLQRGINGVEKSIEYGMKALQYEGQIHERYGILLNLSILLWEDPKNAKFFEPFDKLGNDEKSAQNRRLMFLQAARDLDPMRREAICGISCFYMDCRDFMRALGYAYQFRGVPEPFPAPHNSIKEMYGWRGRAILCQALRYAGFNNNANEIENDVFARAGKMITVCHATRRGKMAENAMQLWLTSAKIPEGIEWIFAIDEDDLETIERLKGYRCVLVPKGNGPVAAWNLAARVGQGNILIQMSDDFTPMTFWDELIVQRIGRQKQVVLQVSDGLRKDGLLTMAIMTRGYYDRYQYMFHADFFSMYSDNELSERAAQDKVLVDAKDIVFIHHHPIGNPENFDKDGNFDMSKMDEVYKRSNDPKNYEEGLKTLHRIRIKRKHKDGVVL